MDVTPPLRPPADREAGQGASDDVQAHGPGTERRGPRAIRRWLGRLVSLVATLAVVGIAGLAVALTAVPAVVGGHTLTVLSGSMVPEFAPGAMVVDRPAPASSLRVGDVITYATTDEVSGTPIFITHRIAEVRSDAGTPTFITRGDANNAADPRPVEASQVRGKVWYSVPYVGTARNFLLAKGAGLILGGAAGLIAAVWFLLRLFRSPEPNAAASAESSTRGGRHRARNTTMATAVLGMLLIAGHPVTDRQGTYAHFSDHQVLQVQITVGSAASSE
jgi:signal peptidase